MTSSFLIRPFEAARIPRGFEGAQILSCPISRRSRRIPAASVPVASEEALSLPTGKTETIGFGLQATDVAIGAGGDAAPSTSPRSNSPRAAFPATVPRHGSR